MMWKRKKSRLSTQTRIAISGVEHRVGTTHFSLMLAWYYSKIYGKKVCVVDVSNTFALKRLGEEWNAHGGYDYEGEDSESYEGKIDGVRIVSQQAQSVIQRISESAYAKEEVVIYDAGVWSGRVFSDFSLCDTLYIIGECSMWGYGMLEDLLRTMTQQQKDKIHVLYTWGVKEVERALSRRYHVDIQAIPYMPEFYMASDSVHQMEKIIWH